MGATPTVVYYTTIHQGGMKGGETLCRRPHFGPISLNAPSCGDAVRLAELRSMSGAPFIVVGEIKCACFF